MKQVLMGRLAMACAVAALFFLRFWRQTRDRLFALFAVAFAVLGVNRVGLALGGTTTCGRTACTGSASWHSSSYWPPSWTRTAPASPRHSRAGVAAPQPAQRRRRAMNRKILIQAATCLEWSSACCCWRHAGSAPGTSTASRPTSTPIRVQNVASLRGCPGAGDPPEPAVLSRLPPAAGADP